MAANEQAWKDFGAFIGKINRTKTDIKEIGRGIDELKELKKEILDDPARKDELKKIIDVRPDLTITGVSDSLTKLNSLKTWLSDNGFL